MSATTNELREELKKNLARLQTLRDEVRVRLHLAGLELKQQWDKLEPSLEDVEKKATELSDASRAALAEAVRRLESFRASLRDKNDAGR